MKKAFRCYASFCSVAFVVVIHLLHSSLRVQGQEKTQEAVTSETTDIAKEHFEKFATKVKTYQLIEEETKQALQLQENPLFRFANENTVFGSVFVWHDDDKRLAAIGTVGSLPISGREVEFIELHLLKPVALSPFSLKGLPSKRWNPDVSRLVIRPMPKAPDVAESERLRIVQMRSLIRRFSASMQNQGSRTHLRLLPQPIYRYVDNTTERDGALFAFVWDIGTDPELILRIEVQAIEGKPTWHYQPIRFTWRELELKLDDVDVWKAEEFFDRELPEQNDPYLTGLTEVLP